MPRVSYSLADLTLIFARGCTIRKAVCSLPLTKVISILDTDYLSGQSKGKDSSKADLQTLLSTQNGGPYGPRSLKSA